MFVCLLNLQFNSFVVVICN